MSTINQSKRYLTSDPIDIPNRSNQINNPSGPKPWENPQPEPSYKYNHTRYTTNYISMSTNNSNYNSNNRSSRK
jgi:hypothetical protein